MQRRDYLTLSAGAFVLLGGGWAAFGGARGIERWGEAEWGAGAWGGVKEKGN